MVYIVVSAKILNDGSVQEGVKRMLRSSPVELRVGGLYFLGSYSPGEGKLYRILEKIEDNAR